MEHRTAHFRVTTVSASGRFIGYGSHVGQQILRERGTRVPSNTCLDKLLKKSDKTRQDIQGQRPWTGWKSQEKKMIIFKKIIFFPSGGLHAGKTKESVAITFDARSQHWLCLNFLLLMIIAYQRCCHRVSQHWICFNYLLSVIIPYQRCCHRVSQHWLCFDSWLCLL